MTVSFRRLSPKLLPFISLLPIGWESTVLTKLIHFLKAELRHYAQNVSSLNLPIPGISAFSILTQQYEGDITIKPLNLKLDSFKGLLSNPTSSKVAEAISAAERETWKSISIIKNHCDIEFAINRCVVELKKRLEQLQGPHDEGAHVRRGHSMITIPGDVAS